MITTSNRMRTAGGPPGTLSFLGGPPGGERSGVGANTCLAGRTTWEREHMDQFDRRLGYARQQQHLRDFTAGQLMSLIAEGKEDTLLLPGQRRRVRHKRGGTGSHRQAQRQRARQVKSRRAALYDALRAGRG